MNALKLIGRFSIKSIFCIMFGLFIVGGGIGCVVVLLLAGEGLGWVARLF